MPTAHAGSVIDGSYHEVKARHGDGIETLLNRYELLHSSEAKNKFLLLNNLNSSSYLLKGKAYQLPVKLYNYNGTSIRSTIGINDWDRAVAIQKYNEALLRKGSRRTHYTASKILWVPDHMVSAESSVSIVSKQAAPKPKINPVYGPSHQQIKSLGQDLANTVVYVVAGHGGPDPGAMCIDCKDTLCEDEYAYDVALRLAKNIEERGGIAEIVVQDANDGIRNGRILQCDKDERLANGAKLPLNQLKRLQQRTNYINKTYKRYLNQGISNQLVISIHVDSNSKSTKQDVFFVYAKGSKNGKLLAGDLRETFADKYQKHQANRGYKGHLHERNIYVLRNTGPRAVLVELANIKNRYDHRRILIQENRQALANWLCDGIVKNAERYDLHLASR
ncbi:MAG: N-acetylmuramoyl-L-alanine amidase [Bacteroidota bacterium]